MVLLVLVFPQKKKQERQSLVWQRTSKHFLRTVVQFIWEGYFERNEQVAFP